MTTLDKKIQAMMKTQEIIDILNTKKTEIVDAVLSDMHNIVKGNACKVAGRRVINIQQWQSIGFR